MSIAIEVTDEDYPTNSSYGVPLTTVTTGAGSNGSGGSALTFSAPGSSQNYFGFYQSVSNSSSNTPTITADYTNFNRRAGTLDLCSAGRRLGLPGRHLETAKGRGLEAVCRQPNIFASNDPTRGPPRVGFFFGMGRPAAASARKEITRQFPRGQSHFRRTKIGTVPKLPSCGS